MAMPFCKKSWTFGLISLITGCEETVQSWWTALGYGWIVFQRYTSCTKLRSAKTCIPGIPEGKDRWTEMKWRGKIYIGKTWLHFRMLEKKLMKALKEFGTSSSFLFRDRSWYPCVVRAICMARLSIVSTSENKGKRHRDWLITFS